MAKTLGSQCRGLGSIPGQGTRSHMLQLKIVHATGKIEDSPCNPINKSLKKKKKESAKQETQVQFLDQEDPLEKEMATHSSIPAWRIPWTEEPGGLQSMGLQSQTRLSD